MNLTIFLPNYCIYNYNYECIESLSDTDDFSEGELVVFKSARYKGYKVAKDIRKYDITTDKRIALMQVIRISDKELFLRSGISLSELLRHIIVKKENNNEVSLLSFNKLNKIWGRGNTFVQNIKDDISDRKNHELLYNSLQTLKGGIHNSFVLGMFYKLSC